MRYKYLIATYPTGESTAKKFEIRDFGDEETFEQAIEWFEDLGCKARQVNKWKFDKHVDTMNGLCEQCLKSPSVTHWTPPQHRFCQDCSDAYIAEVNKQTAFVRGLQAGDFG